MALCGQAHVLLRAPAVARLSRRASSYAPPTPPSAALRPRALPAALFQRRVAVRLSRGRTLLRASAVAASPAPAPAGTPYSSLSVGVPRETHPGEKRAAATPDSVARLVKAGFSVLVEQGLGEGAEHSDDAYLAAGTLLAAAALACGPANGTRAPCVARIALLYVLFLTPRPAGALPGARLVSRAEALGADVVTKVRPFTAEEVGSLKRGAVTVSLVAPAQNKALVAQLAGAGVTALGLDCIPRTLSRAQAFDVLSSQANIAGFRAVMEAAHALPRFLAGQFTMAGNVQPAKVLIIGAGVAGLAAIQTAKAMGAVVRAFDVRAAAREQVEAAGAEFLTVNMKEDGSGAGGYAKEMSPEFIAAEMALFAAQARDCDVIITTALIPGKPAPRLISAEMVASMRPGSVTVDLAAEAGGNIETTVPGSAVRTANGVTCVGYTDLTSRCAGQASAMFANNVTNFVLSLGDSKASLFRVDPEADEAVRGALITSAGAAVWPLPPLPKAEEKAAPAKKAAPLVEAPAPTPTLVAGPDAAAAAFQATLKDAVLIALALATLLALGLTSPSAVQMALATTFLLACLVGFQVVAGVAPALHSPLMSVTNAVSGIRLSQRASASHTSPRR